MSTTLKKFGLALTVCAALAASLGARASVITLAQFDGTESLVNFNSAPIGVFSGPYVAAGVTLTAASGGYWFQAGSGSVVLGTTGTAFNTDGGIGEQQDVTLTSPEVRYLVDFIRTSQRGVILRRPTRRAEELVADE